MTESFSYKHYKSLLNIETYLSNDIPKYLRMYMPRFRCSNFKLNIEMGRYNNILHKERFCQHCLIMYNSYCLEYEFHVLFKLYDDTRSK